MPELPDVEVYKEALQVRVEGKRLIQVRLLNPFLLRTTDPPLAEVHGKLVTGLRRVGKRIVFEFEDELFLVFHLMIAGRLHWSERAPKGGRNTLAVVEFETGGLSLTEAGTKRRASLHLVRGEEALRALDPGGIDPIAASLSEFAAQLRSENHTLKRALTNPRLFSGIGNAYSDEILHRARLSPIAMTVTMSAGQIEVLHRATREVLIEWVERLRAEASNGFPEKVTAFRKGMAVHGRYGEPCPVCGSPVQRIVFAENETNYCARCQTGGRILADRSLSRLLKKSWPRSIDDV